MAKISLSTIIVSYNTRRLLKDCLNSIICLNQLSHLLSSEVIVVDNASSDGSPNMVKKEFPQVKLLENHTNLGYAHANNQGLKIAQAEFLLFLNSDTVVPQPTLPQLIQYLKSHPQVGIITPKLQLKDGLLDPDCHRGFPKPWSALTYFLGLENLFPHVKLFAQYHQFYKNLNQAHEIDACCGAFLLTRKKIIQEIGGWDEAYFFYGEDLDLCYRLKQKGYQVVYFPTVSAVHYKGASSGIRKESFQITTADKKTRLQAVDASIQAMEIFYQKFYQNQYPRYLTFLVLLAIKIKGFLREIKYSLI